MSVRNRVRLLAAVTAAVIAVAVLVPPLIKLQTLRKGIVESISGALGRQVSVREVRLRLLPQPGLDLQGFVVQDDPAFSAEPMLRAEEVNANLRLSSLWRWRPEISSLALKSPAGLQAWSLNVVRRGDGRWNLETLLARASQTPAAPTAKVHPEARLRFPYLEGEGGRINFKSGMEKKVYALSEADFALWLASEKEWNLRLRARPMRTDANLSDTGTLEVSGAFGRAARMDETPVRLRISLQNAQLGQLTYLVYGRDRGWRGSVNLTADLTGTPQQLQLRTSTSIGDFRRYDIIVRDALNIEGSCTAEYRSNMQALLNLNCGTRNGGLAVSGNVRNLAGPRSIDVTLSAQQVQMADVARVARHAKFALPEDLTATGVFDAEFTCCSAHGWSGGGTTRDFTLRADVFGGALALGSIKFGLQPPFPKSKARATASMPPTDNDGHPRLLLAPFSVPLNGTTPAKVQAALSSVGYEIRVEGNAEVQRLFHVARGLGLHAPSFPASGNANLNMQITGNWTGFAVPVSTGSMQLHNLILLFPGVRGAAHIRSATARVTPDEIELQDLALNLAGSHLAVDGSIAIARPCDAAQSCPVRFNLHSNQISIDDLNRLLNPQFQSVPWYRALAGSTASKLGTITARGQIRADRVAVKGLELRNVIAQAELQDRKLRLSNLAGDTLGGKLRGEWSADFARDAPLYTGSGTLQRVALSQLAGLIHTGATGTANGHFKLELTGWTSAELAQSAEGTLDFEWQNGTLEQLSLNDSGPLRLKYFSGRALLHDGRVQFERSKVESANGIYSVAGSASLTRLDLKLNDPKSHSYSISGTLEKPHVSVLPGSETQAALGK